MMCVKYTSQMRNDVAPALAEAKAGLAQAPLDGRIIHCLVSNPVVAVQPELALEWIKRADTFYRPSDLR
jgi:hypothetical protein